jgi:hypothetical protein
MTKVEELRNAIVKEYMAVYPDEKIDSLISAAHAEGAEEGALKMSEAADRLWGLVANVSEGDWSKQTVEWQEAAVRWRDFYHSCLPVLAPKGLL